MLPRRIACMFLITGLVTSMMDYSNALLCDALETV